MQQIRPVSSETKKAARLRWDQVAKPLNSLGILEEDLVRIAGAQNSEAVCLDQKWIAVMCADNGIVEEGVTQTGQEVTAVVAANMARGASCVCLMAAKAGAKVLPVDVGIASDMEGTGILNRKIRYGTRKFPERACHDAGGNGKSHGNRDGSGRDSKRKGLPAGRLR